MNDQEINASNQYLKKIEKGNLVSIGRAASMGWILFVKDSEEYALDLQTSFRFTLDEKVVFASADMFQPSERIKAAGNYHIDTFEWDVQGNNRYDEKVKRFMGQYSQGLFVQEVFMNQAGDLSIQLSEKVKIEVFIDASEEECWRFFKRHSDKHLVMSAEGILDE
ncbi:MAG: hypothetical protein NC548_50385 [Lachnospiraceae bacterium]|nr:hypothetical protein [Lachnospiraceae bacterium]